MAADTNTRLFFTRVADFLFVLALVPQSTLYMLYYMLCTSAMVSASVTDTFYKSRTQEISARILLDISAHIHGQEATDASV